MRFNREQAVVNSHLVQRKYDFHGDDTVVINNAVNTGTAVRAFTDKIYLASSASDTDDDYIGYGLDVMSGTGAGEDRSRITDYAVQTVTNLFTYSEEFDNADWNKTRSTISTDSAIAPDGATTADTLVEDTSTGPSANHVVDQHVAITSGLSYVYSVYAKTGPGSKRWLILNSDFTDSGYDQTHFDLSDGTISYQSSGAVTRHTATIESIDSGWYRCSVIGTAYDSITAVFAIQIGDAYNSLYYDGDGTSGNYLWGGHLTQSSSIEPYVKSGSSATTETTRIATISPTFNVIPDSASKYQVIDRNYA